MKKAFFEEFDESTSYKLKLFEGFLDNWLKVFTNDNYYKNNPLFIMDLFAGQGMDSKGNYGSPLIIIELVQNLCQRIKNENLKVIILLNEKEKNNFEKLKTNIEKSIELCTNKTEHCKYCSLDNLPFKIFIENKEFSNIFSESIYNLLKNTKFPAFIFLDQFGVKEIPEEVFFKLTELTKTDIMFFISSNIIKRFSDQPEIYKLLKISKEEFEKHPNYHLHRIVCNHYRQILKDKNINYYIAPFSLKKGKNYYGLIFGSNNLKGLEKFLDSAWKNDPYTGEASYDIDKDPIRNNQLNLFDSNNSTKKSDLFLCRLKDFIKGKRNNKDIYKFTLENGFLPKHTNGILTDLERENIIIKTPIRPDSKVRKGAFYINYKSDEVLYIQLKM